MKKIFKVLTISLGILMILFSLFFDVLFDHKYYIGSSQLLLILFGVSIIFLTISFKIFLINFSILIGISIATFYSDYFLNFTKSPIIKSSIIELEKNIIDNNQNKIDRFYFKSQNFINQNQYINYFSNKTILNDNKKTELVNFNLNYTIPNLKKKIISNFQIANKNYLETDLNINVIKEIIKKKFKIIVFEYEALPGVKAIGNIYVPKKEKSKFPTVFSVPGCTENLWSDNPHQSDTQHRMELLASNGVVGVTSINLCSNSGFTENHRYEVLKFVIGEDIVDTDLAVLIWMRLKKIYKYFNFIDSENLGITGYSYGGSIINHILYIDEEIKNVALVGTNIRDVYNNQNFINYSFEEIVNNENENYYWSSGPKSLNINIQKTLNKQNLDPNIWRSLIQFDFRKNFLLVFGKNDTAINQGRKRNIIKNLNFINSANETVNTKKNIEIIENNQNHNFSKENNILVVKFFLKNFIIRMI